MEFKYEIFILIFFVIAVYYLFINKDIEKAIFFLGVISVWAVILSIVNIAKGFKKK